MAEQRDWKHEEHHHLSRVASHLRAELSDRDTYRCYQVANDLHSNFCEDEMEAWDIAESPDDLRP
jgi:hypothetical protein